MVYVVENLSSDLSASFAEYCINVQSVPRPSLNDFPLMNPSTHFTHHLQMDSPPASNGSNSSLTSGQSQRQTVQCCCLLPENEQKSLLHV